MAAPEVRCRHARERTAGIFNMDAYFPPAQSNATTVLRGGAVPAAMSGRPAQISSAVPFIVLPMCGTTLHSAAHCAANGMPSWRSA